MKYGSDLSPKTAGDTGEHGFPSDQLIRSIRVGLLECGWFYFDRLFEATPRDFTMILVGPDRGHALVKRYREPDKLLAAIPHSDRLVGLPRLPFVGELSFMEIAAILKKQQRFFQRAERQVIDDLADYLEFKSAKAPERTWQWRRAHPQPPDPGS